VALGFAVTSMLLVPYLLEAKRSVPTLMCIGTRILFSYR
jgi:hypothetical protein